MLNPITHQTMYPIKASKSALSLSVKVANTHAIQFKGNTKPTKPPIDAPALSLKERLLSLLSPIRNCTVKSFSVALPQLPKNLNGLRLVQISDPQCYEYTSPGYWQKVVAKVKALNPDVIVMTGDLIHVGRKYLQQASDFLKALPTVNQAGKPIVRLACMGNHDYYDGPPGKEYSQGDGKQAIDCMQKAGFQVLINESVEIPGDNGANLRISAVDDYYHMMTEAQKSKLDKNALVEPAFQKAFEKVQPQDAHIALIHNPDPHLVHRAAKDSKTPPGLILSGHTHGGQFTSTLPILKGYFERRIKRFMGDNPYLIGAYPVQDTGTVLYVNPGTGSSWGLGKHDSLPAFRLGSKPEISLFVLRTTAGQKTQLQPMKNP